MPTLQDVADLAGVSTATVSKVLSNTPYFSEATRQKVMDVVQKIGYRPNLAARALSSGKTNIIAVVFPYIYDAIFKDPLVMHILEGVESVCTDAGYNLLLSTPRLKDNGIDEQYQALLQSGYTEGIIAIDNVPYHSFAADAEALNIPTVTLGYHVANYSVRSDDRAGGKLALDYILNQGHKHIGIISVPTRYNTAIAHRLEGMREAAHDANTTFEHFHIVQGDFSSNSGRDAVQKLLTQEPEITAILSVNDRMAIGAINQLQAMNYSVPHDISVIGYDNITMAGVSNPALTTIDQNPVELGRQAAQLIFERLNGSEPSNVVLLPTLIERGTVIQR